MFDEHDVQVLQIIIGGITAVILAYLTYLTAKVNAGQKAAATEAREVKQTLADTTEATATKLDHIAKVGQTTHDLCNSAMLEQKRMHWVKCETAAVDNPTAANISEARMAKEAYNTHLAKQNSMERNNTGTIQSDEEMQ